MIELLFPRGVGTAEAFGDPADAAILPAEESLISQAVEKRRREFTTARHCGRQALGQLGIEPVPIAISGIPNNHFAYAWTWFMLAMVWAGMTAYLISRIRRRSY